MADPEGYTKPRPRRRGTAPTIADVARAAGVSKGTVSRVLNGRDWVSPQTRDRVHQAMTDTGFVANATARSLATQRTGNVAFILGTAPTRLFEDPNYAVLLQVTSEELARQDYALILLTAGTAAERHRAARFVRGGHVDGVLFVSPREERTDDLISLLRTQPVPVIACGRPFVHGDPLPFVATNDRSGATELGRHFRTRGYRRVGIIAGHLHTVGAQARVQAFTEAADGITRPEWLVDAGEYSRQSGANAMLQLLARAQGLDAVFATSDLLAEGAIDVIKQAKLRIPDDIAVAGFDDSAIAQRTSPPLTTVRQSVSAVAREMVRQLAAGVRGEPPRTLWVDTELIVRASA
ncbi:LacI family DNA-binding transcriptional regulator [Streptomyces sp. 6N223]|uniref:LacI family DNA-binding transcriptional regulator n=1 Tax=Streptomyces sp. 6N223 TaxID=3457412 RepID=UPI003FD0E588